MNLIGEKIFEARKLKGLTQEELAEHSNVNLRTIQRIENSQSNPRGKTLSLICEVLEIDMKSLVSDFYSFQGEKTGVQIANGLFLLLLNLVLVAVIGFLTLDSNANLNSKFGGYLLSFFLPIFIVVLTKEMTAIERLLKFGFGYLVYFIFILITNGFPTGFLSGLFPCLLLSITVLYFGANLIPSRKRGHKNFTQTNA